MNIGRLVFNSNMLIVNIILLVKNIVEVNKLYMYNTLSQNEFKSLKDSAFLAGVEMLLAIFFYLNVTMILIGG